jgi:hypothetical protein
MDWSELVEDPLQNQLIAKRKSKNVGRMTIKDLE